MAYLGVLPVKIAAAKASPFYAPTRAAPLTITTRIAQAAKASPFYAPGPRSYTTGIPTAVFRKVLPTVIPITAPEPAPAPAPTYAAPTPTYAAPAPITPAPIMPPSYALPDISQSFSPAGGTKPSITTPEPQTAEPQTAEEGKIPASSMMIVGVAALAALFLATRKKKRA